ncbi:hypothetical protein, partial [uncultured Helicobacter sp.]|uniref:hypothetical protein n=1 Tax=uncultured Helicobacter sp. TaxID=175537 RepID=UPI003445CB4A
MCLPKHRLFIICGYHNTKAHYTLLCGSKNCKIIEKEKRYNKALKDYEYQQKEIKRLQAIADRFRYKPSKASMA